jgi:hypothetical protein
MHPYTGRIVYRQVRPDAVQVRVTLRGRSVFRVVDLWLKGAFTWRNRRHHRQIVHFRLRDTADQGKHRIDWTASFTHRIPEPRKVSFSGLLFLYLATRPVKNLGSAVRAYRDELGRVSLVVR